MTAISDIVTVNVNIQDTALTRTGFGTLLILVNAEAAVFAARTKPYNSIDEVAVDFASSSDPYLAAATFFAQSPIKKPLKFGRQEAGDTDAADALAQIVLEDDDWYGLAMNDHVEADILDGQAFCASRLKIFGADSDLASLITAGTPASVTGIVRVGQTATATTGSAHGLSDGALVEIAGADQPEYNGTFIISNASASVFDYTVVGTPDTPATGTMTWVLSNLGALFKTSAENRTFIFYTENADTEFGVVGWLAKQLATLPGESTWNFKQLSGVTGSTLGNLSAAQEAFALGNNVNVYPFLGATGLAATRKGTMASGRFIDVQRSQDWLQQRISEAIIARLLIEPKVPYTDAGAAVLKAETAQVMDQAVFQSMLGPLLTSESGEFYRITAPKVADQLLADRAARDFPGIVVTAQLAGAIHETEITVNVSV